MTLVGNVQDKNRKTTIQLILKPIEGVKGKTSSGIVDPRLFNGENELYAIKDPQTCLWHVQYKQGVLPPKLKQRFTSYDLLLTYVTDYYKTRNIEIVKIVD